MFSIFRSLQNKKNSAKGTTVEFAIDGMHCTSCAMNIDGALEDLDGVLTAQTSYAQAKVVIQYDPEKISVKDLAATIKKEGYSPRLR